jgi:hypothetical protein
MQPSVQYVASQHSVIERATWWREAHDHRPATRYRAIEPDPPGIQAVFGGIDHADREPVINNARHSEHLGLADRVANPGSNRGGKINGQLAKPTMRLNKQVKCAQLFEYAARPADAGELSRNGP